MKPSQGINYVHPFADDGIEPGPEPVNERWAEIPILPDAFCLMFFGQRGSGKSAVIAKCGKDEAAAGKQVWYWPESFKFKYGKPIDALTLYSMPDYLQNGVLLVDEFQVLMNRLRTVSTANLLGGTMLQQLRKRGLNVYGTSNDPGRLDQTVSEQTDWHYFCELIKDQRCYEKGYHMRSCDDHVRVRFVDTNRKFGNDYRHWDGRKRGRGVFWKIRDVYGVYDTGAIADITEVMAITKENIMNRKVDSESGLSLQSLVETLRTQWVPWAATSGYTNIGVAAFTATVNEKFGFKLTSQQMGIALKELGLRSKSNGKARVVALPPKERINDWQDGLWVPE